MKKLYFLGPKGTYSEIAANKTAKMLESVELIPVSTIAKVIDIVNRDDKALAVLPIENSIEGIVRPTIDNLYLTDVKIQLQLDIPIEHCLIGKGNKGEIENIISHPQALAQCQKYITDNFSQNINLINATSTAASVEEILDKDKNYAAIASENALRGDLKVLEKNIGDIKDNKTRFVLLSKIDLNIAPKTRTSIVFNTKNEPGALLKILEIFKKYDLNLCYLESRPSKKVFGEYNFFVDINKGLEEIRPAITEVKRECNYYKLIGSYPVL